MNEDDYWGFSCEETGDAKIMKIILNDKADVNIADYYGKWTPLMGAASRGRTDLVKMLLDRGADVNMFTIDQDTALMWACQEGHIEVVKMLLDAGADIHVRECIFGDTAITKASSEGHTEIVSMLLDKGDDANAKDDDDNTALMRASDGGYTETVSLLLKNEADVNEITKDGRTALMRASSEGHAETVSLLLKNGADLHAEDVNGNTCLECAISSNPDGGVSEVALAETIEILLDAGADLNGIKKTSLALESVLYDIRERIRIKETNMAHLVIKKGNTKDNNPLMPSAVKETITNIASFF